MLKTIGVSDVSKLYSDIPADLQAQAEKAAAELPAGVSEFEALEQLKWIRQFVDAVETQGA